MNDEMLTYEEVGALIGRQRRIGNIYIDIYPSGLGGRYQAFITTPDVNLFLETPITVRIEGIITFYERIHPDVYAAYKNGNINKMEIYKP